MFLPETEFDQKYPQGKVIGSGCFGTTYQSGDYVVKVDPGQSIVNVFNSTLIEVDSYSKFNHPNILQLEDWTFNSSNICKLALPLGIPVQTGVQDGFLKFNEVASGLLSALILLRSAGIFHDDLRTDNMICLNGRVVLIDFGVARRTFEYRNGEFVVNRGLHVFQDPERNTEMVSAKVELFEIGVILLQLFGGLDVEDLDSIPVSTFQSSRLSPEEQDIVNDLIHFPIDPPQGRLSAEEILNKYPQLRFIPGTKVETPVISLNRNCHGDILKETIFWIMDRISQSNATVRSLFTAVHNLHRCLEILLPYNSSMEEIQKVALGCILLSQFINGDNLEPADIGQMDSIIPVLICLQGIISTQTPWDAAESYSDLLEYFKDMLTCDYNPAWVVETPSGQIDKNQSCNRFAHDFLDSPPKSESKIKTIPHPCQIDYIPKRTSVKFQWLMGLIKRYRNSYPTTSHSLVGMLSLNNKLTSNVLSSYREIQLLPVKQQEEFRMALRQIPVGQKIDTILATVLIK